MTRQPAGAGESGLQQCPLCHHLLVQQDYFGVSLGKSCSVFCNHCCPLDNVAVEGFKSIRILMAVIFLVSFLHFAWTQLRG